jgi:thiol-disulfide isomerase/thioredoxin
MKKYLLIFLIVFSFQESKSQDVEFYTYKGWKDMLRVAKKENKKVFLFFHADWCAPCKTIQKICFKDSAVYSFLNSAAINVSINIDDSSTKELVRKFMINTVPAVATLSNDGYPLALEQFMPSENAGDFYKWLTSVFLVDKKIEGLSNSLNVPYPPFYYDYFKSRTRPEISSDVVKNYLQEQMARHQLFTESSWAVISVFPGSNYFLNLLVDNYDQFFQLYGKRVSQIIGNSYRFGLREYVKTRDSVAFSKLVNTMVLHGWKKEKARDGYLFQWIEFLAHTGLDWSRYREYVATYIHEFGSKDNLFFAGSIYKVCGDSVTCKYISDLISTDLEKGDKAKNFMVYAALLMRCSENELANKYFEKSLAVDGSEERRTEIDELKAYKL